jgi:hypothetical protein
MDTTKTYLSKFITKPTNVSVEWILKNVTYSVDGFNLCGMCESDEPYCCGCPTGETVIDWAEMIEEKFWDTDLELMASLLEGIKRPICLVHSERGWTQGNGHHRLATAILAAMDSIPVVFSFDASEYMMMRYTM